ncbi:hypothetical protein D3C75_1113130 [compost metagenome]
MKGGKPLSKSFSQLTGIYPVGRRGHALFSGELSDEVGVVFESDSARDLVQIRIGIS